MAVAAPAQAGQSRSVAVDELPIARRHRRGTADPDGRAADAPGSDTACSPGAQPGCSADKWAEVNL